VSKTPYSPGIALAINKFKTNKHIFIKSFPSSICTTFCLAKLDACGAACAYIITNLMTDIQQLDNIDRQLDDGSEDDRSEDEDSNLEDGIRDPDGIDGIPEGEPAAIDDGSFKSDEDMSESYYSGSDQDDTTLSVLNKNQLQGKIIPRTDGVFLKRVEIVSKMLKDSKQEAIAARKIELQLELEEEVIQSTEVYSSTEVIWELF
jgi:hypothetical protein